MISEDSSSHLYIEYCILSKLCEFFPEPVGAVTLSLKLGPKLGLSQASLGRRLLKIEKDGYARKISYSGRVVTEPGLRRRQELNTLLTQRRKAEELVAAMDNSGMSLTKVLESLIVRQPLEALSAKLAAQNGTEKDVLEILEMARLCLMEQEQGGTGRQYDLRFHIAVANASKNEVLAKAISVLRQDEILSVLVSAMCCDSPVLWPAEDHILVAEAIKSRNPDMAQSMMNRHIKNCQDKVVAYWEKMKEVTS